MSRSLFFTCIISLYTAALSAQTIRPESITIARDAYGVPHIYGKTDADAAYGLAWAHAEDDFESIQLNLLPGRGLAGSVQGKEGVLFDYGLKFTGLDTTVPKLYQTDISADFKKVLNGYVQGLNAFALKFPERILHKDLFPVTEIDILHGYMLKLSLMAGMGLALKATKESRIEMFNAPNEKGSNALVISADRMEDAQTLLIANSHQPIEGAFAWYEVHINSEEGWNTLGGLFPGGVTVFVGSNENLGWAHTNNYHTFGDIYKLQTKGQKKYFYDGKWIDFKTRKAKLKIKLGGLKLAVSKKLYDSEFGPVFKTKHGMYAFRFPAYMDIRAAEQWFRMNKAKNWKEFETALRMEAVPMFNTLYADRENNIFMQSGGQIPLRDPSLDWKQPVDGSLSAYKWTKLLPFERKPTLLNPSCGFIYNANNSPLFASGYDCEWQGDFIGLQLFEYNRGERFKKLLNNHTGKFSDSLIHRIKYDKSYDEAGTYADRFKQVYGLDPVKYPKLEQSIRSLKAWDRSAEVSDTNAALVLVMQKMLSKKIDVPFGFLMIRNEIISEADAVWAIKKAQQFLIQKHGKVNIPLGQVQRHIRGSVSLPAGGLSEVPRATDAKLYDKKAGIYRVNGGDGYIQFAKFSKEGVRIRSVNAYGASARPESVHYTDQMELFMEEKTKPMTLHKDSVLKQAVRIYHPQ